jgi:GAF domain-containing protein
VTTLDQASCRDLADPRRRSLELADLDRLASALSAAGQPLTSYRAVEALSGEVIGHRLFTIMRLVSDGREVERVYTSNPVVYPVGGRKQKADTKWADHVLRDMKIFRASGPEDIVAAFDDHETILRLGIGSIINVPIVFDQQCLGTMNFCHAAGWYREEDEDIARVLAAFLIPPLAGASFPPLTDLAK